MTTSRTTTDQLLVHLVAADRKAAADMAVGLVRQGMSLPTVVGAIADAMREVGDLWALAIWTVADEHAATAVAEAALSAAAAASGVRTPGRNGEVVVACVEGDWHGLPSRMAAELLVADGWRVRYLGASQPTDLLVGYVTVHRPAVVVLSCSVPMALPALGEAVTAVQSTGVPVIVGGRALGASDHRARVLGAAGWGIDVLGILADDAPPPLPDEEASGQFGSELLAEVASVADEWESAGMRRLTELMPVMAQFPAAALLRTRTDLRHLIDMTAVSLRLHEEDLLLEQCEWLHSVLVSRGVPSGALSHGLVALRDTVPAMRPVTTALVHGLLEDSVASVNAPALR